MILTGQISSAMDAGTNYIAPQTQRCRRRTRFRQHPPSTDSYNASRQGGAGGARSFMGVMRPRRILRLSAAWRARRCWRGAFDDRSPDPVLGAASGRRRAVAKSAAILKYRRMSAARRARPASRIQVNPNTYAQRNRISSVKEYLAASQVTAAAFAEGER